MKRSSLVAAVIALASASSRQAAAAGTELPDQSASTSGMGGVGTARSGDPTAAFFNPAALVDGEGLRVGLGTSLALASLSAKSSDGAPPPVYTVDSESSLRPIPYLAASYAYRWLAGGVSLHVPYGGGVAWPRDSALRFESIATNLRVFRVAPFVGARFKSVAIAGGPSFDYGSLEVERATNHVVDEGSVHLATTGSAVGGHAAVFVQATDMLAFGLTYKSRTVIGLGGDANFGVPATFAPQYPDQGVSARFKLPDRIAFGTGLTLAQTTRLYLDVVYSTWSVNDELVFDFEQPVTPDSRIKNEWRDTMALRIGGEHEVTPSLVVRAGAFVDGLFGPAAPASNLSPTSPDMSRVGGSIGGAWMFTRGVGLDVFYSFFGLVARDSTSDDYPLARYSGSAHIFGFGLRFGWNPERPPSP